MNASVDWHGSIELLTGEASSNMASEQHAAVQASLARNLLSSVLALAFPDDLVTNAEAHRDFIAQVPQVSAMFEQHSVFEYVTEGKALDKFQSKLFELVDQAGVLRDVKAAAFELLLVVVEQLPLEQLEQWLPKLIERVTKMVKYIKDGPNVVASACAVARILLRHVEMYSPEARRELFDLLSKLFPALLTVLLELGKPYEEVLSKDEVALFANGLDVFTELLQASPTSVRSSLSKLESAAALVFYNASLATDATARRSAARCLATLANASDKTPQMWKQIVDKTIEMAHLQVELIAGKRMVSSAQTTVLKNWLRDESATADLVTKLSIYKRAEAVCQRLSIAVEVLEECVASRYVCEREVQLVINDVVTLSRRILAVRAHEIGKQSAISEDGFRLPASVVYGVLPQFHQLGLRALQATVERAGLCALRQASKITKTLSLAAENVHPESHAALYQGVAICVRALGASTLERLGQPLLDHMVVQCKEDLEADETKSKKALEADAKAQVENKSGKTGKGKKRKRQIGDVSQLSADAAGPGALFMSARNQRLLVGNVDAALNAIATCVAVYGSLLPMESRSLASEVALLAAQQQLKRQAFLAVPQTNAGLSPVAMLLLTDAVSADANGAHATNVVPSVQYLSGLPSSSLLQRLALNATEALLHPRGPPLTVNVDSAVPTAPVMNGSTYGSSVTNHSVKSVKLPGAANVRGNLDWEKEDATMANNEPETEDNASTKRTKVENGSKSADVDMQAAENDVEEEEEEEEEDYDDERPVATEAEVEVQEASEEPVVQRTTAAVSTLAVDEDDDDEFPDIVVDDADDE